MSRARSVGTKGSGFGGVTVLGWNDGGRRGREREAGMSAELKASDRRRRKRSRIGSDRKDKMIEI